MCVHIYVYIYGAQAAVELAVEALEKEKAALLLLLHEKVDADFLSPSLSLSLPPSLPPSLALSLSPSHAQTHTHTHAQEEAARASAEEKEALLRRTLTMEEEKKEAVTAMEDTLQAKIAQLQAAADQACIFLLI